MKKSNVVIAGLATIILLTFFDGCPQPSSSGIEPNSPPVTAQAVIQFGPPLETLTKQ